ncbi:hypothetical protein E2562_023221 [Oryza meyeriana var. granulata]|uniref:Uncharacterized protein n=1 Tax=Oryza meyeriana var. granulata TaxID=110450 RepID=A0A6G1BYV9_9ORYZ|nr:hypothetical protein E2562_023221 [Oryza meyeriana var. granulata]
MESIQSCNMSSTEPEVGLGVGTENTEDATEIGNEVVQISGGGEEREVEGGDDNEKNARKSIAARSEIWKHFIEIKDDKDVPKKGKCKKLYPDDDATTQDNDSEEPNETEGARIKSLIARLLRENTGGSGSNKSELDKKLYPDDDATTQDNDSEEPNEIEGARIKSLIARLLRENTDGSGSNKSELDKLKELAGLDFFKLKGTEVSIQVSRVLDEMKNYWALHEVGSNMGPVEEVDMENRDDQKRKKKEIGKAKEFSEEIVEEVMEEPE